MMGNNQKGVFGGEVKLNRMGKFPSVCMTNCSELFTCGQLWNGILIRFLASNVNTWMI